MPTAEQAYIENLAWRAVNAPETIQANEQFAANQLAGAIDAAREQAKYIAAFSQPRSDLPTSYSPTFQSIQQQYESSRNRVVSGSGYVWQGEVKSSINPYPERSAAGIAWEVGRTGGAVDIGVAQRAIWEGAKPSEVLVAGIGGFGERINTSVQDLFTGASKIFGIEGVPIVQQQPASISTEQYMASLPTPFISTPSAAPVQQQQQSFDLLNFLGLGGGAVGQQAFQSAVSGQHPATVQQGGMGFGMPQYASDEIMRMSEGFGSAFWGGVSSIFGGGGGVSAGGGADIGSPMVQAPGIVTEAKLPGTATVYTPFGEYAQTAVENAKLAIDPLTGELGIYQQTRAGNWMLVGGGGRAAVQSGMFSVEKPLTPVVYTQESGGGKFAPTADLYMAERVLAAPEAFSRLGAEAYGGFVQPLDSRTLTPESRVSTYSDIYNLANYAQPLGVNLGKAAAPGANIPWQLPAGAGAVSFMGPEGLTGVGASLPGTQYGERLIGGGKVAAMPEYTQVTLPSPFISSPYQQSQQPSTVATPESGIMSGLLSIPGFVPVAIATDIATSYIFGKPEQSPFAGVSKELYGGNIASAYEKANVDLSRYTTDISGISRGLQATPSYGDVGDFFKGVYIGAATHPIDIAASYGGGVALSLAEGASRIAVAKAATSGLPIAGTFGRAASSPFAADIFGIGKAAVGGAVIFMAGENIISQPTATLKGEVLGRTAAEFAGFGVGTGAVKLPEPENPFAGRGFFSGVPEIGPIERAQFKAETTIRSLASAEPAGYREVAAIAIPPRLVEPAVRAEPQFEILSTSGKYASEIKSTLVEQPHSVVGSSALIQQYPEAIAESAGLRIGKDVDVLIESPTKALQTLSGRAKLPVEEAQKILDVHPIPAKYPGFTQSTEADVSAESSIITKVFGDPYRSIAFPRSAGEIVFAGEKGYRGDITYEAAQVQFGRKSSAVALVMQEPIRYGYRAEKDIYDLISGYHAQRAVAIARGTPESQFASSDKALQSLMERTITYGTAKGQRTAEEAPVVTRRIGDIYTGMLEQTRISRESLRRGEELQGVPEIRVIGSQPERGVVSEIFRSAAPSAYPVSEFSRYVVSGSKYQSPSEVGSRFASGYSIRSKFVVQSPYATPSSTKYIIPSTPSYPPSSTYIKSPPSTPPSPPSLSPPSYPPSYPTPPSSPPTYPTLYPPSTPTITPPTYRPPHSPPTYTPPTYPPFYPPITTPPVVPNLFGGVPGASPLHRKRRAAFLETFTLGLDIGFMNRRPKRAKSYKSPKKPRKVAKRKK